MKASGGIVLLCALAVTALSCGGGSEGQSLPTRTAPTAPGPPPPVLPARVSVYSVPSPYSGNYTEGMWIRLITEFEEPVKIEGSPRLIIDVGGGTRYAEFAPSEFGHRYSTPEHRARFRFMPRFDYLIQEDDLDVDGFSIGPDYFDFSEGSLLNEAGVEIEVDLEVHSDLRAHPVDGTPRPRTCTDELERARGGSPALVDEWDGGTPFVFYFSLAGTPDHLHGAVDRVLQAAERLSGRIEDQIGYSLFEVGGTLEDARVGDPLDGDCGGREPGQIIGVYQADGPARANRRCATWVGGLSFGAGTVSHELFHLFGFEHHPESWRNPGQYDRGVFMSNRLNGVYLDDEDVGVAYEDVDALRCIFPRRG